MDEKVPEKKLKSKSKNMFLFRHLMEFFRTTGLHGYKYIAMNDAPLFDRLVWTAAVLVCLVSAVILVVVAWGWNLSNPTLTVIETIHSPAWKYPFPAVTICSLNKVSQANALSFAKSLNRTEADMFFDVFNALKYSTILLGNHKVNDSVAAELKILQKILNSNNITIEQTMEKITPSCDQILDKCTWKGSIDRCDTLFQRIISSDGFCCSFNYYAYEKTNFPPKVDSSSPKSPRKVAGCGFTTALSVLVKTDTSDYFSSILSTLGVKVFIHYAFDYPDENAAIKIVERLSEAFFSVAPEVTQSTTAIIGFTVKKRGCVFYYERKSKIYNKYTYTNCLVECRSKVVFKLCGCVPYFLPNNGSRKTCDFDNVECLYKIRNIYSSSVPSVNGSSCNCEPNCQYYTYPVELSTGVINNIAGERSQNVFSRGIENHSLIHVFFNDLVATKYRRDIYMSWFNLLASFGGLLSLFIGFSLVSAFELIYFFTIRLFFDLAQRNKDTKLKEEARVPTDNGKIKTQLLSKDAHTKSQNGVQFIDFKDKSNF